MEKMLRSLNIKYEYLIMGLPPGPRYLINDKNILRLDAEETARISGLDFKIDTVLISCKTLSVLVGSPKLELH